MRRTHSGGRPLTLVAAAVTVRSDSRVSLVAFWARRHPGAIGRATSGLTLKYLNRDGRTAEVSCLSMTSAVPGDPWMVERPRPVFGERAISWRTVWNELVPDPEEAPHDDALAADMHRLRGLVMAQACETEAVLGAILRHFNMAANVERPAGLLLREVRQMPDAYTRHGWSDALNFIKQAIDCRNRAVHGSVEIGSVWRDYQAGGGVWVSVISLMGGEMYDEEDLLRDLALQQEATIAAVHLLYSLNQCGKEDEATA